MTDENKTMIIKKLMPRQEIKHWIKRWKRLKPSKKRDMAIKI